jgi:hypothetical protein
MSKKIKFSASFFIIILSFVFSAIVYAEDYTTTGTNQPIVCTMDAKLCPDGVTSVGRVGPNCEFQKCPGENTGVKREDIKNKFQEIKGQIKDNRTGVNTQRDTVKNEINTIKTDLKAKKDEIKTQLNQVVGSIKAKRDEFKAQFELDKEAAKAKIAETKATFKENIAKIKDENKKVASEKIVNTILDLNGTITNNLSNKIDQIENVLVSIESRTAKAESGGLDVTSVKTKIDAAKMTITSAREAISTQSKKTYVIGTINDEVTLKTAMKTLRDSFTKDIKTLREVVKSAHIAVSDAAATLAKIPKINDVVVKIDNTTKVDNTGTTSATTN